MARGRSKPRVLARKREARPGVECLEGRALLALTIQFADGVLVTGKPPVDVEANAVANDAVGNVYVTGSLQGSANFNPSGSTVLTSTGGRDIFLAKYNRTGGLVWAKDLPGAAATSVAQGAAIAVDGAGNVAIAGTFTGVVNFDPNAGNTSFVAAGRNDAFVARYDPSGNLLWARDVVGTAGTIDEAYALAVDGSGNLAIGGSYQGTAAFGSNTLTAAGSFEGFVAAVSATGSFLWAATTSGTGNSVAQSAGVAFDGSGNVVATGFFAGQVNFNPAGPGLTLPYAGSRDIFVEKLTPSGALSWALGLGSPDIDQGAAIAADASGNVYVTGTFSGTVNFNAGSGSASNLTASGYSDGFVLALGPTGAFTWAKDIGESANTSATGTGIALDGVGHLYVGGDYQGTLTLDPVATGGQLVSAGGYDGFLGEFTTSGAFIARVSIGAANFDAAFAIDANAAGLVAVVGRYTGPVTLGSTTLPASLNRSIFVTEVAGSPQVAPPAPNAPALEAASDSGLSNSDRVTNITSPVFDLSGITAPGYLVELLRDGVVVGSRTGAGPITDPGPVPDGVHSYTARQTDSGGLVSPVSGASAVTTKTRTPPTPAAPGLFSADDSGVVGDGVTNVARPRITTSVEPLTLAQLIDSTGNVIVSGLAAADGSCVLPLPSALADGTYAYRVREEDVAGNFSAIGAAFTMVIDTTPPAAPPAPALLAADDSGALGDGITNVKQPRLAGSVSAGASVQILDAGGNVIGAGSAAADGSYSIRLANPLADGTYTIRARLVDVAGNLGAASPPFSLTILTATPATPPLPALLAADDSGTPGDNITNVIRPRLTGTVSSGLTVQIVDPGLNVLGAAAIGPGGVYTVAFASALADGTYTVRVRVVDVAGNVSAASPGLSLRILSTQPPAPSTPGLSPADDTGTKGDGITTVHQPHLVGAAGVGLTVLILDTSNNPLGSAAVASDGSYTVLVTRPFADGTYLLKARAIDVAGNVSVDSGVFSLTIQAPVVVPPTPSPPLLVRADDSGVVGDGITNVRSPHVSGTAVAGETVEIVDSTGALLGSAATAADGSYAVLLVGPLAEGIYALQARARDGSGNVSLLSAVFSLRILLTPPLAPGQPVLLAADDSGVKGDNITNVRQPHFTGTAAVGTTVQLLDAGGNVLGSVAVAADGSYSVQPSAPLADATFSLRARAVDIAGNVGPGSPALTIQILATPPAAPAAPAILAADDTWPRNDSQTAVRQPHLVGSVVPGATVELLDPNGVVLSSTTAAVLTGAYTLQPAKNLGVGVLPLRVRVRDVAGNVSAPGGTLNLKIVDATAGDFDGDGKTDLSLFFPKEGLWASTPATGGPSVFTYFGGKKYTDIPVPADYDGLGHAELAVFHVATGQWVVNGPTGPRTFYFGGPNLLDIPVPGDYDGVGYAEPAVFRPSTAQWFVLGPNGGHLLGTFGATNLFDLPIPGDYDGTGQAEMAVFRPSTAQWFVMGPTGGRLLGSFGAAKLQDLPVPGDYDGIGHIELAVFRPSTAQFFVLSPGGGRILGTYGSTNLYDVPTATSVGSLKKLGTVGGITIASVPQASPMIAVSPLSASFTSSPATKKSPSLVITCALPDRQAVASRVMTRQRPEQAVSCAGSKGLVGVGDASIIPTR